MSDKEMTLAEMMDNANRLERLLREIIEDDPENELAAATRQNLVLARRLIRAVKRSK